MTKDDHKPLTPEERAEAVKLCEVEREFPRFIRVTISDVEPKFMRPIANYFAQARTLLPRYEATVRELERRLQIAELEKELIGLNWADDQASSNCYEEAIKLVEARIARLKGADHEA